MPIYSVTTEMGRLNHEQREKLAVGNALKDLTTSS